MKRRSMVPVALTAIVLAGLVLVSVSGQSGALAGTHEPGPGNQVTIVTDSAGIPHITAWSFRGLGYGEAWAFAADDFCTLAQDFVTVNGERSRYFGPNALAVDYAAGTFPTNLQSDMFWQAVKKSGLYAQEMNAPPPVGPLPQVKQLYEGFVAGYNAYLRSGELNDPTCAGQPWVRPITLEDLFLRLLQIDTEGSSAQFITAEATAAPPSGSASSATSSAPRASALDLAALEKLRENGESVIGSNGIGVGGQDTRSGDGMVLANPHFPWEGPDRFWMAQLTVPGMYDMEGGTLMGFPLVGIGFNSSIAWTQTESTDDRFTFYRLKLVPGDPTSYYVNGKATPMGQETVTVDTGTGSVSHTFYTTRWGTVIDLPPADYEWTKSTAYTVDDGDLADEWRMANEYFEMGRATSVQGLLQVEEQYLGNPLFNTIAADDHGNALYADVGNTPNVSSQLIAACQPSGLPTEVYEETGFITLNGSTTNCAWQTSPGTPVPGIFNGSQEPHVIRTDYVENSNDSYWLANPSDPFPAYSPIIGDIDVQQGLRTRLGNEMIAQRVAGTDGLGPPKFTIQTMLEMWENDRSLLAELVLKPLVTDCESAPDQKASNGTSVNLTAACAALADFENYGNGDLDAAGGWLFSIWADALNPAQMWTVPFNPAQPLTTPYGLNTSDPAVLQALANAVLNLQKNNIPLDATFGEVQHATRGALVIPIHGCNDAMGCFNAIETTLNPGAPLAVGDYGETDYGSSMVIAAELTRCGPVAEGILTYSQATNPLSPWYANMTKLYSQKQWVNLPYTPAQLAAQSGNETTVLTY
jgi:acyl-homoserine-lactone acylase